jgi:transposase InsO family protein
LRAHGYELVHRGSRPKGDEPLRFEAPRRNALWQLDFTELRVGSEKLALLVVLDDFSRFVVGHTLCDSPEAEVAVEVLRLAIARHGRPEAVRTDRGGAFLSAAFKRALEGELIDHIVGRAYHPEGGGKVEAVIGTVKRELWEVEHFATRREAERRLASFVAEYNERRAHMGIDGLTPADRYFGRADRVLAELDAVSRQRNGAREQRAERGAAVEEGRAAGAPMEVLRLVVRDGHMELRFCGASVRLGPVQV